MSRLRALTCPMIAAAYVAGCSDDANPHDYIGPVPTSTAQGPQGGEAGAPPAPAALPATLCPSTPEPTEAGVTPMSTVHGIAVTDSRVYAATSKGIAAFTRKGDCPASPETTFHGGFFETGDEPLAVAARDGVGVIAAGAHGAILVVDGHTPPVCLSSTPVRSVTIAPDAPFAYSSFVAPEVRRLALGATDTGCSPPATPLPGLVSSIRAIAATDDSGGLVASYRDPGGELVTGMFWVPMTGAAQASRSAIRVGCSARTIVATRLGVAALDAACGRIRLLDISRGVETAVYPMPEGTVGRGLATIPGTDRLLLATTRAGEPPRWIVVDLAP